MPSSLQVHRIHNATTNFDHPKQTPNTIVPISVPDNIKHHHTHAPRANQCCSVIVHTIAAPLPTVWSVVRRFDAPQSYKKFLKSCDVVAGDGSVGTLREVRVVSGLPAGLSRERLDILDDERHVISFSVVGGDHRLSNYRSVTTLHAGEEGKGTVVVESYVVDVPAGNTEEETRGFTDTIVRCNLQSLGRVTENLTKNIVTFNNINQSSSS